MRILSPSGKILRSMVQINEELGGDHMVPDFLRPFNKPVLPPLTQEEKDKYHKHLVTGGDSAKPAASAPAAAAKAPERPKRPSPQASAEPERPEKAAKVSPAATPKVPSLDGLVRATREDERRTAHLDAQRGVQAPVVRGLEDMRRPPAREWRSGHVS